MVRRGAGAYNAADPRHPGRGCLPVNEHDAFLQAICESPDDDGPRLMYADWLTERGDPRGEFIRLQCELAVMPEHDVRRIALTTRESELAQRYSQGWRDALPQRKGVIWGIFERGFPAEVSVASVRAFLRYADVIHEATPAPAVRFPVLTSDTVRELVASPKSAHLRKLEIDSPFVGPEDVCALAESPHLSRLRVLILSCRPIGSRGAAALAGSSFWAALFHLGLNRTDLGDGGLSALAAGPRAVALIELSLALNGITEVGARLLARGFAPALERLNLRHNALRTAGAEVLLTSPILRRLAVLDLTHNEIGPLRLKRLVSAEPGALRRLDLRGNRLGTRGTRGLARCPRLDGLQELDLTSNELDDTSIAALVDSPFLAGLRRLALGMNLICDEGARTLARSLHWTELNELNLNTNRIGDEGVAALLASPLGKNLESLYLGGNRHGTKAQSAVQRRRVEKQPRQERCPPKQRLRDT
jgi:uncharacterized protein (TIGR02996 family)